MSKPLSFQFSELKTALEQKDERRARNLFAAIDSVKTSDAARQLLSMLKKRADNVGISLEQSDSGIGRGPDIECGRYYRYPDQTGKREREDGKRLWADPVLRQSTPGEPLVTIITVVFNNVKTIERCIRSVLAQTYDNIEYIVVDGGSTDGTVEVIAQYKKTIDYYVSEPDGGIYDAMNKGLSLAQGEYIAFLNADDYYLSQAVSLSVQNIFSQNIQVSYAGFYYSGENGEIVVADEPRPWDPSMLIMGIPGGHETLFVHKYVYNRLGGYNTSYKVVADYHWFLRAYLDGVSAAPLKKIILVMDMGGASFSESRERTENVDLLRRLFGALSNEWLDFLYNLKYYKNWHGWDCHEHDLTERMADAVSISSGLHEALALTVDHMKQWPSPVINPAHRPYPGRKTICIALTYLTGASGGAERIAIETANALRKAGHSVTIVSCHGLAGEPYYSVDASIPVIDLAAHPYKHVYLSSADEIASDYDSWAGEDFPELTYHPNKEDFKQYINSHHGWKARLYKGFFSQHHFDVVVSHMPSTYPYVYLGLEGDEHTLHIASLHNAPRFKFYSNLYPAESGMERYIRLATLKKADRVGVLFPEFIHQMPKQYQEKCFVLPNYVSPELNGPRLDGSSVDAKKIVTVGRLAPQKDHETLVKAFAQIKKEFPDWALEIYGDGPLRKKLETLSAELGLDPQDIFKGVKRELKQVYSDASIFAFPSIFEGFGLTVVEAMRFELPVVAFADCEGVRNIVRHEMDGVLVPSDDRVRQMADGLRKLIRSPNLRMRYGSEAYRRSQDYTIEQHLDALYREIALNHRTDKDKLPARPARPLKIAILTTYTEGGAGIAARRLCGALRGIGHDARLVSFSPPVRSGDYMLRLLPPQREIYNACRNVASDAHKKDGGTLVSSSYPGLSFEQLEFLKYFDVINLHWVQTFLTNESVSFLELLGKPIVWTLHDMNPFTGACHYSNGCMQYMEDCHGCEQVKSTLLDLPSLTLRAKRRHWTRTINVVSPSRWLADCARRSSVFKDNPICVIPNSVDTNLFKPIPKGVARRQFSVPEGKYILLFSCQSHAERRKGFYELIQLSQELEARTPGKYHVVLFGEPSDSLADLALDYTALGHISSESEIAAAYNVADLTVLPTWEDNLPNILLESISCGVPVVAFDSGGVRDAVIDGLTGRLVPRGDVTAMADLVEKVSVEDYSLQCRTYALRNFALERQARAYQSLFESLGTTPCVSEKPSKPKFRVFPEVKPVFRDILCSV